MLRAPALESYRYTVTAAHAQATERESHRDVWELIVTVTGLEEVVAANRCFEIGAGRSCLVPAGCEHSIRTGDRGATTHRLRFRAAQIEMLADEAGLRRGAAAVRSFRTPPGVGDALAVLRREYGQARPAAALMVEALATHVALASLRASGAVPASGSSPVIAPQDRIGRARALLDGAPHASHSLDELAGAASMSRFHFLREFKRAYGVTPHAYLLGLRLEQAIALMRRGYLTLTAVAHAVGFSSQSRFTEAFRRRYGVCPSRWPEGQLS